MIFYWNRYFLGLIWELLELTELKEIPAIKDSV